jgi:hypothetical protein
MRLYPEQMGDSYQNPDGKRALFGKNDWGVPGEMHIARPMAYARGVTQLFAHHNPSYQPSHVDPGSGLGDPFARLRPAQAPGMMPSTFLPPVAQRAAFTSAGEPKVNRLTRPSAGEFLISERPSVRERAVLRSSGLGELSPRLGTTWGVWGGLGDGFTVYPDGKTAISAGIGMLYRENGQVKITSPVGPFIVNDITTIYPNAAEALKIPGFGRVYAQNGKYYVSSPVGGIEIKSPYVQGGGAVVAPPPPVPTVQPVTAPSPSPAPPAPSPTPSQMASPPPAPAPNPSAPPPSASTGATPAPPASLPPPTPTPSQQAGGGVPINAPTPAPSSTGTAMPPLVNASSGGGAGSLSSSGSGALSTEDTATVAPGPVGFFSSTLTLPVVGTVPTWSVLAALGAFGFVMWRRKKGRR